MFSKTKSMVSLLLAVAMSTVVMVTPAFAATAQYLCEDGSGPYGTWEGVDDENGTCTYTTEVDEFYSWCEPADTRFVITYVAGAETTAICYSDPTPSSGTSESTDTRNSHPSTGGGQAGTLTLGAGKNGGATFPEGTCGQKCSISSSLPAGANNSLPSNAIATLYVRVVDEGGQPGAGSYTVCFANPDGAVLTIYRYVGGAWVALQIANTNPVCVNASGDGAFYLS